VLAARAGPAGAAADTAGLAFDVYVHRLRALLGSMAAAMGGLDLLVFTGGIGEHSPEVRAAAARNLGFLGVGVDEVNNAGTAVDGEITAAGSRVRTFVVTAREDVEIARLVREALAGRSQ
jgi:acetate kinase